MHRTGIAPFYIYKNQKKPWLNPVYMVSLLMLRYVKCPRGLVFRRKLANGFFSQEPNQGMVSATAHQHVIAD